ncbi:hypothetical protein F909_00829 [Acinetobacter sp. ANC 3929]|nr:hypothetical protein F909_00829 [Acinetobacter sp. ANC 3929]
MQHEVLLEITEQYRGLNINTGHPFKTEVSMEAANFTMWVGFGLIAVAVIAVFFSPYRRWLGFMLAGMLCWGLLEVVRFGAQTIFEMSVAYSYLTALSLAMITVTFILLREDKQAQKQLANRQYIEHTPVYKDDQQQCSSR